MSSFTNYNFRSSSSLLRCARCEKPERQVKLSACLTGLGIAGRKEELTTGLLTKLAAELAKGLEERGGNCEGKALEPENGLEGLKGTAEEPLKEFLWLLTKGSGFF